MNTADLTRLRRSRRYQDGDCVACGREPRGEGVLGSRCREANNARRRTGRPIGRPSPYPQPFRDAAVSHTTGPLTIKEAAQALEVSPAALWRWRKKAGLVRERKAA